MHVPRPTYAAHRPSRCTRAPTPPYPPYGTGTAHNSQPTILYNYYILYTTNMLAYFYRRHTRIYFLTKSDIDMLIRLWYNAYARNKVVIRDIAAVFCISSKHYRLLYFFCTKHLTCGFVCDIMIMWDGQSLTCTSYWLALYHGILLTISFWLSASWLLAFFHTVPIFRENGFHVLCLGHWFCLGIWIPLFREWCFCLFFVFLFKHALIQLTFFGNGGSYD